MGKKKFNLCMKCNFRHALPTGKGCLARDGEQALDKPIEDETIQGGQVSSRVGLNDHCDSPNRRKAGSSQERIEKIEQDMTAMGGKLDLIIANMKGPTLEVMEENEVVGDWTKDIAEAWSEVKDRSRQKHKPAKPLKPRPRRQRSSSSSDSSSSDSLEEKGDTRRFARKRFFPKDFKVKRSEEIVHACVKTVDKVLNEGGTHRTRCVIFTHFSVENTVKKVEKAKNGKYKLANANGAKTNGICFRFNSEEGCAGKCYFIHKCSECDSKAHGKKDCKKSSK